ncbi:tRNA-splicing ligase RtcB [Actinopolyspora alba]|uniref:3'-phosphate/5'-hydroxy nucleic acid ligase n=2 Tax=Actinopolyspora alba TaxID=673379 RepID=A0A1I1VTS7_9ACTN|nr:RtcB family protein [Actinopolyspora alba]SFD85458.1 tRNA-splicing ligase RtcB [Actinopolyspora alba]
MTDFPVLLSGTRAPTFMWATEHDVEPAVLDQLRNIAALPWVHGVRVMPDVHLGKGATVGSVIAMRDAVSPAAVGVDIGCGMEGVKTSLHADDLPADLGGIRTSIERAVPVGFRAHDEAVDPARLGLDTSEWQDLWRRFGELHGGVSSLESKAGKQLGTLGGGNHFIEVCLDEHDAVWLMLHSGSRHIGNRLAEQHIAEARELPHNQDLPDRDLAVFVAGTPQMAAYRNDLFWAQEYARVNRRIMLALTMRALRGCFTGRRIEFDEPISCHHNYVAEETIDGQPMLVTRKGAIRAGRGDMGLIPGSMGTGSYVVRGLGSDDSFQSAAHGAGRRMSRKKAKRTFGSRDLREQTSGIECRKDDGVLDEIPGAYKDIDSVIDAQTALVEVVAKLRQVVCVKG